MQLFKMGGTILNVTHSIEEAVYLSNRIYILAPNPCKVQAAIDVNFDSRRTDAIRQTTLCETSRTSNVRNT